MQCCLLWFRSCSNLETLSVRMSVSLSLLVLCGNNFCQALVSLKCHFPHQDAPRPRSLELESMRTGGVILTTGQPCLFLNPSPHSLHPVQLFGRLYWLKTRLKQAKGVQIAHETEPSDVFLTILMELEPPTILPCIVHIMRMIFTFYSLSFWPSWSKICCCKGSKQQFWWW